MEQPWLLHWMWWTRWKFSVGLDTATGAGVERQEEAHIFGEGVATEHADRLSPMQPSGKERLGQWVGRKVKMWSTNTIPGRKAAGISMIWCPKWIGAFEVQLLPVVWSLCKGDGFPDCFHTMICCPFWIVGLWQHLAVRKVLHPSPTPHTETRWILVRSTRASGPEALNHLKVPPLFLASWIAPWVFQPSFETLQHAMCDCLRHITLRKTSPVDSYLPLKRMYLSKEWASTPNTPVKQIFWSAQNTIWKQLGSQSKLNNKSGKRLS